jgi:16S rRNA (cytidine1402-2'-O)-methyltransferase
MSGKLFLIPSELSDSPPEFHFPNFNISVINEINTYIVENERTARRFLKKAGINTSIDDLTFHVLDKHTNESDYEGFLNNIKSEDIGLLSEAGTPCIADPGAAIVQIAQKKNIEVIPLVGANSIILGLMASGLNGQSFAFNGYLPVKQPARNQKIKFFEKRSSQEKQTQIFIETPYRNKQLFDELCKSLLPSTILCIATDITSPDESIKTKSVKDWKQKTPDLHKKPTVFLFLAS